MTTESWLEELESSDKYAQAHRNTGTYFKLKNDEDTAIVEFIGPYGEPQEPIQDKFNPGKTKTMYRFGVRVYEQTDEDIGDEDELLKQWDVSISRRDEISRMLKKHSNTKVFEVTRHGEPNSKQTNYVLKPITVLNPNSSSKEEEKEEDPKSQTQRKIHKSHSS